MYVMRNARRPRWIRGLAALLAVAAAVASAAAGRLALAAWLDPPVEAPGKSEVGVDDDEDVNRKERRANVLFFLDTSHPMMFEPRGRVPYVVQSSSGVIDSAKTKAQYGYTAVEAIDMMKYATFGVGTVPPADSFYTGRLQKWVNYGRDTDPSNNLVAVSGAVDLNSAQNMYRYYSPYAHDGHNLQATFRNQTDAYPGTDATGLGYAFGDTDAIKRNRPLPYMLVFKNPAYWERGMPGFNPGNPKHLEELVPNDSRLYQTKLVMWRLLEDRMLFENIRFGLSTVYSVAFTSRPGLTNEVPAPNQSRTVTANHIVYKVAPWGADGTYVNGAYYITSDGTTWSNSGQSKSQQGGTWGIYQANGAVLNRQRRSFLRVPIAAYDKIWITKGGAVRMSQLDRFRQWIDGVEDIAGQAGTGASAAARDHDLNANQFDIHKNPELKVSSPIHLSRALFPNPSGSSSGSSTNPNRAWYFANQGVAYAKKNDIFYAESGGNDLYNFYFKPGSGQAVGSVLDFFSPDYDKFNSGLSNLGSTNGGASGESFADMIDEQFPIRDVCDPNYVVLLTAGDNSPAEYPTETAIKALYDYTATNPVTVMYRDDKGARRYAKARLDKPVRTLVVGFVDPNDNSTTGQNLRRTLLRMARAGQGDDPDDNSSAARPYLANDVPSLLAALREVMVIINNDIQPAKGPMLEGDTLVSDNLDGLDPNAARSNLYAGAYRINLFDQWEGSLTKYVTAKDKATGKMVTKKSGELGAKIRSARDTNPNNPRNLLFWDGRAGGGFAPVGFTGQSAAGKAAPHPLAELVGLGGEIMASMDVSAVPGGSFAGKTHPSRAMFDWYYGYDASYIDNTYYKRRFMLADQGKSGTARAGKPHDADSLPGFREFAQGLSAMPERLYAQTNDGVLHVVNPETMGEESAILPPPSLLPRRAFKLKANLQASGMYKWVDVKDFNANTSDDIPISSAPAYILDGPLQARHFNLGANDAAGWNWRTFLIGALGRGGSGLYAMDVTDTKDMRFCWYRETIENGDGSLSLLWRSRGDSAPGGAPHPAAPHMARVNRDASYWNDLYAKPGAHAYEQLGFNSPRPYFTVAEFTDKSTYKNLIAVGGGMQNRLNLNDNGTTGAALYLIDPDERCHGAKNPDGGVRVFNGGSLSGVSSKWRVGKAPRGADPYMGMVNSEPVFLSSKGSNYIARGAFFADNRGSVFYVNFADPATGQPYADWNSWGVRTVASLRANGDAPTDSYSIPSGLMGDARRSSPDRLWVAGGTANVARADPPDKDAQALVNKSQMIFAFVMPDLVSGEMTKRDRWTSLNPDAGSSGIMKSDEGWYIPLGRVSGEFKDEYVTTRPVLFGGNLYVATFRERKVSAGHAGSCESGSLSGLSRLYAVSLESGQSVLWNDGGSKYLQFDGIKISGFTVSERGGKSTLIVSYQVLDQNDADKDIDGNTDREKSLSKADGLDALVINMVENGGGRGNVTSNDGVMNYWRFMQ
jgi:hypothetical protein